MYYSKSSFSGQLALLNFSTVTTKLTFVEMTQLLNQMKFLTSVNLDGEIS